MTVFLTPDGAPFFCGTYFPKAHFQRLVVAVAQADQPEQADAAEEHEQAEQAVAEHVYQSPE